MLPCISALETAVYQLSQKSSGYQLSCIIISNCTFLNSFVHYNTFCKCSRCHVLATQVYCHLPFACPYYKDESVQNTYMHCKDTFKSNTIIVQIQITSIIIDSFIILFQVHNFTIQMRTSQQKIILMHSIRDSINYI